MTNCPTCGDQAVLFCGCEIGDMMCQNKHTFNVDSNGNAVLCDGHNNTKENEDTCPTCLNLPKFYCKCDFSERCCENGHKWYYDANGKKVSGMAHN